MATKKTTKTTKTTEPVREPVSPLVVALNKVEAAMWYIQYEQDSYITGLKHVSDRLERMAQAVRSESANYVSHDYRANSVSSAADIVREVMNGMGNTELSSLIQRAQEVEAAKRNLTVVLAEFAKLQAELGIWS